MARPDPAPAEPDTSPGSWRDDVTLASGLNVVAGLWLVLSPFVLDYGPDDLIWNPIACGAVVVLLGLARLLAARRATELSAGNAAVGLWLFAAVFWLSDSAQAVWNTWSLGVVVFVLAVLSAAATPQHRPV